MPRPAIERVPDRKGLSVPPYLSYKTFDGFISRLRRDQDRLPNKIDRSLMPSLSGSAQSQLLAAVRYLGLVSPAGGRTDKLVALVNSVDRGYQRALREILRSAYPFLFQGFDLSRATSDELYKRFAAEGAAGETLRKCVGFFLKAARHAEIPVSPFLHSLKRRRRSNVRQALSRKLSSGENHSESGTGRSLGDAGGMPKQETLPKLPEFDPDWPLEIQNKWFEAYLEILRKGGNAGSAG